MIDSITPPPELVTEWILESDIPGEDMYEGIATRAAQWGADQGLEACLANIHTMYGKDKADWLRAMRRPKPPSLKEQALDELASAERLYPADWSTIRRALEALPE